MPRPAVDPMAWLVGPIPPAAAVASSFRASPSFLGFCEQLGVTLEPGQRVACKVAFDGVDPKYLRGEEREIAREMFGDIDTFGENARRIVVAVCGARGGKTYVFTALRMLHLALTVPLTTLAPGEVASAPIIAPDKDLAAQALHYVQGAIQSHPDLSSMVVGKPDAAESVEFMRDGHVVEISVKAASARGRTGRGRSLVAAAMEEAAFFRDANYQVNDDEIYKALSPRIMPGGQLIIDSTPWAQVGLVYDLFSANHPNPERAGILDVKPRMSGTAIAIHASTLRLRDVPLTRAIVASERDRDPENAEREFGARFMSAANETFFDPLTISKCIDDEMDIPFLPEPGDEVMSGGDLGFSKNSSALVVVHKRGDQMSVADIVEKKPAEGASLKPSEVCREFAAKIAEHGGSYLMADGHYKATAVEHLGNVGLGFRDAPTAPAEAFIATRTAMREGRVHFPNHPRLLRQLRETVARRGSGGTVSVVLPKWRTGEHGDLAAAFVLAVYQGIGERVEAAKPEPGTREYDEMQMAVIREQRRRDLEHERDAGDSTVARWRPGQGTARWGR